MQRDDLLKCLGGQWPTPGPLLAQVGGVVQADGFRREYVTYEVEPGERVPAFLLIPDGVDADHPVPAVAVWHQHAGRWDLGKSEPAGLLGDPRQHTGAALAREGFVVLCPDALGFEERADATLAGARFEDFLFLRYVVAGKSLAWKNILDMRRAIDYLESRPEVLGDSLGCCGHSMGSTFTWLLGPFEPRLKALVGTCCLPTYAAVDRHKVIHGRTNYIPGLLAFGDTPDVAALTAPRPLMLTFGELDGDSPMDGVRPGIATIARTYADAGSPQNFASFIEPEVAHELTEEMWARAVAWLHRHLRG